MNTNHGKHTNIELSEIRDRLDVIIEIMSDKKKTKVPDEVPDLPMIMPEAIHRKIAEMVQGYQRSSEKYEALDQLTKFAWFVIHTYAVAHKSRNFKENKDE